MLLTDPEVRAVTVQDCGEPLVDVLSRYDDRVRLDDRERNPSGAYRLLRADVVTRLHEAAAALPAGIGLLVVEGWRDPNDQHRRFIKYLQRLAWEHPDLGNAALQDRAAAFVSPVEVAPHCTGGAVDLTLIDLVSNTELDLGGSVNAHRSGDNRSCPLAASDLRSGQRAHRDLLAEAMTGAGFINYPTEWWHWSTGERYWAATTHAPAARYGPTTS